MVRCVSGGALPRCSMPRPRSAPSRVALRCRNCSPRLDAHPLSFAVLHRHAATVFQLKPGHRRYEADYWFIGLEEGGASSIGDLAKRIEVWRQLGSREIEDVYAFHDALGFTDW